MLPDLAGWQELGDLPALVVTWAARLVDAQDALLWLVEGEDQRLGGAVWYRPVLRQRGPQPQ
jgi:hypothetical protein